MSARIAGWGGIGWGKGAAAQRCVGVCQDRKVELVLAGDYDALLARTQNSNRPWP